jgi:scytalone dehydratase
MLTRLLHPVKTQHMLGHSTFSRVSETEAKGSFQARAYHTRTFQDGTQPVWEAFATVELNFVKIDGEWKLGGWRPHTVTVQTGKVGDVMGKL